MSFIKEPLARFVEWATHSQKKRVYGFNEGSASDVALLGERMCQKMKTNNLKGLRHFFTIDIGNKGANLCEMARLGLPVPPGFTISTEACIEYFNDNKQQLPNNLVDEYTKFVHEIERQTGRLFGAASIPSPSSATKLPAAARDFPLLLSVRSGAAVSMPGMMGICTTSVNANIL